MGNLDQVIDFKRFASQLVRKYSGMLAGKDKPYKHRLIQLDKAIYQMENELSGKQADIYTTIEHNPYINEKTLNEDLSAITRSSLKELLRQNV
jgi:phosphoenolpyruvate carboxylase